MIIRILKPPEHEMKEPEYKTIMQIIYCRALVCYHATSIYQSFLQLNCQVCLLNQVFQILVTQRMSMSLQFGLISSTLLQISKAHKKNGVGSPKARTLIVAVADGWLRFWHMQDGKLVCEY